MKDLVRFALRCSFAILLVTASNLAGAAAPGTVDDEPKTVAILIFDGVELLDFWTSGSIHCGWSASTVSRVYGRTDDPTDQNHGWDHHQA